MKTDHDSATAAPQVPAAANPIRYEDCWAKTTADGKPGISVRDHCLNVGCVAEALIELLPAHLRDLLPRGAAAFAALHDVGKISPGFQQKCPRWKQCIPIPPELYETDHAKVSQWFLQSWPQAEARKLRLWFMAVGAHHGQSKGDWIKSAKYGGTDIKHRGGIEWDQARRQVAEEVRAFFRPPDGSPDWPPTPPPTNSWQAYIGFFAGLLSVADWVGSDERFFPAGVETPSLSPDQRREKARYALSAIGFGNPQVHKDSDFARLFPKLSTQNSLQKAAVDHVLAPGLYIIEGPMGCGKTEAALLAAARLIADGHARGLYFGLPTQTTSNRLYERAEPFLRNLLVNAAALRLAHGASRLRKDDVLHIRPARTTSHAGSKDEEDASAWAACIWFASVRRALLAQFGVGTVDQALLGVVAARHFFVRQFGLAGKVAVLDEVHSYDLYTSTLVDALVGDLLRLRCTVLVLSATLTRRRRAQLLERARCALLDLEDPKPFEEEASAPAETSPLPYPLLSGLNDRGETIEVPIASTAEAKPPVRLRCQEFRFGELAAECASRSEDGLVVLWIRNTVAEAQRAFAAVNGELRTGGPRVALLHSRYPWFRREELERAWLGRLGIEVTRRWQRRFAPLRDRWPKRRGCVVVATQVVEQSVDIDADFLVTDLAPTDMLLQRLGRLWRHERGPRANAAPEAWVHAPDCGGLTKVPEIKAKLKGLAPPYDAYVLLRSQREWAGRPAIALPDDIRRILERTYAPWEDEPSVWRSLREELERKRESFIGRALVSANRWGAQALPDDEGVQTRLSELPTLTLVLLRSLESQGGEVRITPLDGDPAIAPEREWSHAAAVALHRNHVKIPAWWLRDKKPHRPDALRRYFLGNWAWATWDGENLWINGREGESAALKYLPDRGVWCESVDGRFPKSDYSEDDDEFGG
jgi:CRISPR-associated endonuclease/helicase Cas3